VIKILIIMQAIFYVKDFPLIFLKKSLDLQSLKLKQK